MADKNIYRISREEASFTRESASMQEALIEIAMSPESIEKIESGKRGARPEEVVAMADAYKKPELCNYFCTHECAIGQRYIPEVKVKDLAQITLEMVNSLNTLNKEKERLIEIVVDGQITEDEYTDFIRIKDNLDNIALTIDGLQLWLQQTIAAGKIDMKALEAARK